MKKIMMNLAVFAAAASLAVFLPFTSYAKEIDDVELSEEEKIVAVETTPVEELSDEENTEEVASAEEEGTIEVPNYDEDADLYEEEARQAEENLKAREKEAKEAEQKKKAEKDLGNALVKEEKKLAASMVTGMVDQMAKQWPQLTFILTPFKALISDMFALGASNDPNAATMEKLKEIDKHLDSMEANLKQHSEDLAVFTSIGGDFQDVKKHTKSLSDKITGIRNAYNSGEITIEEYNKEIAALYNSSEYAALTSALNGATLDYDGDTSYAIDQKSIFGAAYNLQCNKVMFSGEAIDCTTPYLLRQLGTYLRGYAVINVVLDSYEQVNGASRTVTIRGTMYDNTERVVKLYNEYFGTYRYTFVNKSSNPANHVRLNRNIVVQRGFTADFVGWKAVDNENKLRNYTPPVMTRFPLSKDQMNSLAKYAKSKNKSIYDILFDEVGFTMDVCPTTEIVKVFGLNYNYTTLNEKTELTVPKFNGVNVVGVETITLKDLIKRLDNSYMPTGPQYMTYESSYSTGSSRPSYNYMQAIQINKVGAEDTKVLLADKYQVHCNPTMLYFTR